MPVHKKLFVYELFAFRKQEFAPCMSNETTLYFLQRCFIMSIFVFVVIELCKTIGGELYGNCGAYQEFDSCLLSSR